MDSFAASYPKAQSKVNLAECGMELPMGRQIIAAGVVVRSKIFERHHSARGHTGAVRYCMLFDNLGPDK